MICTEAGCGPCGIREDPTPIRRRSDDSGAIRRRVAAQISNRMRRKPDWVRGVVSSATAKRFGVAKLGEAISPSARRSACAFEAERQGCVLSAEMAAC